MENKADIGIIGLAVMGENLILNMAEKGFTVACYNRTLSKVDAFMQGRAAGKTIIGCHTIEEFVQALKPPRRAMIMVKAGKAVDAIIDQLLPLLDEGDIIIDGGNSYYKDTNRRLARVEADHKLYIGIGVSGGEEGALKGPSLMPGGSPDAWPHLRDIFFAAAAKTDAGEPCCDWVGPGGSGHFVKMVHNGIEYGDMQLIAEAYALLRQRLGYTNQQMHQIFSQWNQGELDSYLIEITADILDYKDEHGRYVLDYILDAAGQKGTGKWTVQEALDLGQPLTLIAEAVFARCLSALKEQRLRVAQTIRAPQPPSLALLPKEYTRQLQQALYAAKIISYAQGFQLLKAASEEFGWQLDLGSIAMMWRGGCVIRSVFLERIKQAYAQNPDLENLVLDPFFSEAVNEAQPGWRTILADAVLSGIPAPAMNASLAYADALRSENLPANLLQAQRDYFGAHLYERTDQPRGQFFHTNWTGHGGTTVSSSYNV
jgi:6-phosphogluconate dehydrogenase